MHTLHLQYLSSFLPSTTLSTLNKHNKRKPKTILCTTDHHHHHHHSDPWTLSSGNNRHPSKPKPKNHKFRHSSSSGRKRANTPNWVRRTPEQMVKYLEDDRNDKLYGKHVVAAIKRVRGLSGKRVGEYDMRVVMGGFVGKLSFRDMCLVLKAQRSWRQAYDFFHWMKLQLSYSPSVVVYTILLRVCGQVGKIELAEQTFLEMLEAGCEPDQVASGTMLCVYARWGRHKPMLSFYDAVQERGVVLSVTVYNFMLSSLQKKSLHSDVVELWRDMIENGIAPTEFTYTVVITSLVKEGHDKNAFQTFYEMKSLGFVPQEVTYSFLISLSNRNGNYDEALRLYEDMRSQGIVPSNYTCASLLAIYYKSGDYSRALSLFSEMECNNIEADEVIYGLLIRIYGKLGLYADAEKTYEEVKQLGLLANEKTYLATAQVYLSGGECEKALSVIELMKSKNIVFSRFAYIVLLQCYVMKEDLTSAETIFQSLTMMGLPDAGACSDMLNLYIRLNAIEKAKEFILQIRKDQVDFDEELYKKVIEVYIKVGMLIHAKKLTEEMVAKKSLKNSKFFQTVYKAMFKDAGDSNIFAALHEVDTSALGLMLSFYIGDGNYFRTIEILKLLCGIDGGLRIVNQLASKFVKEGELSTAKTMIDEMIKLGILPDDEVVAFLINAYAKHQKLKQAYDLYVSVAKLSTVGKFITSSIIDAYVKSGNSDEAYLLYKESREKERDIGAVAVSIIVNALTNTGKYQEAENTIHESFKDKLDLDTVAYNTFIKAMLEGGKLNNAVVIFERMLSMGVRPSIQTYNTMISVHGQSCNLDKAVEMFNTACDAGLSLDEKTYMNLIGHHGRAGKIHEASNLFNRMLKEGVKPSVVSYNMMINMYASAGLYHELERLFEAMREGCSANPSTYLALVRVYMEMQNFSKVEEVIKSMVKQGISPSCNQFNYILSTFMEAGLLKEAESTYNALLTCGTRPDISTNRIMLRGYMEHGHLEKAVCFFEQIKENVQADRFIMSAGVHLYKILGNKIEAENVLNSMRHQGVQFLDSLKLISKRKILLDN